MHTDIGIPPAVSSLATNIQGRMIPLATKMRRCISSFARKAKEAVIPDRSGRWIRNTAPLVAVLGGALAFGFWQDSIGAGLFAFFFLWFLAGIYKTLRQIVATLRRERDHVIPANSNWNASTTGERSDLNVEVGAKAIEHLRPWVEDGAALTDESAKAYCSVLLNTLASLHPKFAE